MDYKRKRRLIIGISLFLLLVFYLFKNISTSFRIFSFIFGIFIFYLVDHMFDIDFKLSHYLNIIAILALSWLFAPLYYLSPLYDKILHLTMPILAGILIFYIVDKQKLNLQWKLWIVFLFVVSTLAFFEIGEYLMDQLWNFNFQGVYLRVSNFEKLNLTMSKIDDTMIDLILGVIGSLLFVSWKTISFFYHRRIKK